MRELGQVYEKGGIQKRD
jgi:TPR repeat protein